jgi:hypothetical protein
MGMEWSWRADAALSRPQRGPRPRNLRYPAGFNTLCKVPPCLRHLNQQHLVALVCDRLRQFETRGGMAPVVLGIHTTHPTRTDATAGFGQNALTPILFRDHALSTKDSLNNNCYDSAGFRGLIV